MSKPLASWLSGEATPDYTKMTQEALIDLWAAHRNDMLGRMAADEVMCRLRRSTQNDESRPKPL